MILKPFEDQQDAALAALVRPSLRPRLFTHRFDSVPAGFAYEQPIQETVGSGLIRLFQA